MRADIARYHRFFPKKIRKSSYSAKTNPYIAPMTVMSAKVCLTFLHRDKPTGLQSLNEDLVAPLYVYINRHFLASIIQIN